MDSDAALPTDFISMPVCFSFRQAASSYPLVSGLVCAERRALAKMTSVPPLYQWKKLSVLLYWDLLALSAVITVIVFARLLGPQVQ